jgi:trans-aconitate methyltransferase
MNVVRKQWNEKAEEWGKFAQDDTSYWTRRLQAIVGLSVKHVPPGRSLDVGCGPGLLVRLLTEAGFEAHGADISENMVQKAASLLEGLVPDPAARVHHCPDGGVPDAYYGIARFRIIQKARSLFQVLIVAERSYLAKRFGRI